MADPTVQVHFGAATSELEAKIAIAKAQLADVTAQMRSLASQAVASGTAASAGLRSKLELLSSTPQGLKGHIADLEEELSGGAGGMTSIGLTASQAAQSVRALADEFSSGRIRQGIGSLVRDFGMIAAANPEFAAIAAGVAVAGAAIAYFAVQAREASSAVTQIVNNAAVSGTLSNFQNLQEAGRRWYDQLRQIDGISDVFNRPSSSDAAKIIESFTSISGASQTLTNALVPINDEFAKAIGDEPAQWAKQLGDAMNNPISKGQQLLDRLRNISPAQQQAFDQARQSGNIYQAQAALLTVLISRYKDLQSNLNIAKAAQEDDAQAVTLGLNAAGQFDTSLSSNVNNLQLLNSQLNDTIAKLENYRNVLQNTASTPQLTAAVSESLVHSLNPVPAQIDEVQAKITSLEQRMIDLKLPGVASDTTEVRNTSAAIDELRQKLAQLRDEQAGGSPMQLGDLSQAQAALQYGQDDLRAAQAKVGYAQQELAQAVSETAQKKAQKELADAELEVRSKMAELAKANANVARASKPSSDTGADIAKGQADKSADSLQYGTNSAQALNDIAQIKEAQRAAAEQAKQEAASSAEAQEQSTLNSIAAQIAAVKEAANQNRISRTQELADLLSLNNQKAAAETQLYAKLKTILDQGTQSYRDAQKKMSEAASQAAKDNAKTQQEVSDQIDQAYRRTFEQIGSSATSSIMGMIQGTETLGGAARSVALDLVREFVSANIKWAMDTLASVATQTQAVAAGQVAQTGAVTAGVAARTAAQSAGSVAPVIEMATQATQVIRAAAGEAAAAVFAFLSPAMGPAAAPAAGAFSTVLAYGSFATGAYQIDRDQIAAIHRGEMILPDRGGVASEFRSFMSGGGFKGAQGDSTTSGDTHHHYNMNSTNHFNASKMTESDLVDIMSRNGKKIMRSWALRHPNFQL